jgi:hypothetical protein
VKSRRCTIWIGDRVDREPGSLPPCGGAQKFLDTNLGYLARTDLCWLIRSLNSLPSMVLAPGILSCLRWRQISPVLKHYFVKARGGMDVKRCTFLTSGGRQWVSSFTLWPLYFPTEGIRCLLDRRPGDPQSRFGLGDEKEIIVPEIEPVATHSTDRGVTILLWGADFQSSLLCGPILKQW